MGQHKMAANGKLHSHQTKIIMPVAQPLLRSPCITCLFGHFYFWSIQHSVSQLSHLHSFKFLLP